MMAFCNHCNRSFLNDHALKQHERDSSYHNTPVCNKCNIYFASWIGLKEHYVQSRGHFYCQMCEEHFSSKAKILSHCTCFHFFCTMHHQMHDDAESLNQHYLESGDHHYCHLCFLLFTNKAGLLKHRNQCHYVCRYCAEFFSSEAQLASHEQCDHLYCHPCDRTFPTRSNIEHHLGSALHQPRTLQCLGRKCDKAFICVSALIAHAESGSCPSGITRKTVDKFVVRNDLQNIITNPARLITGPGAPSAPPEREYWATERSWNGFAYECFLCHAEFRTLDSLNRHLKSPKHKARIYRCPMAGCGIEYSVLSSLCQHAEHGSCGVGRSREVLDVMDRVKRVSLSRRLKYA